MQNLLCYYGDGFFYVKENVTVSLHSSAVLLFRRLANFVVNLLAFLPRESPCANSVYLCYVVIIGF